MSAEKQSATQPARAQQPASETAAAAPPAVLAQRLGNWNLQQLLQGRLLQAKLTVSDPHDPFEQEADRVADQVMRMPDGGSPIGGASSAPAGTPAVQRACVACEEEEGRVSRSPAGGDAASGAVVPPVVHQAIDAPGQPLDPATREYFEPRFGVDFSRVRVHTGAPAAAAAKAINARAFTYGHAVVFGEGEYAPRSTPGQRLIAHELTHVAQQGAASARVWRDRLPEIDPGKPTRKFSTGTPVRTGGHTQKPNLDIEYLIEVTPGVGPDQRRRSAALLTYERDVWIRNKRGDEARLRIHAHSDLNPPFDPKESNFKHLKAPGFSTFDWDISIKYSEKTGGVLNYWHPVDGALRHHAVENQSLPDLAASEAPPCAQFFLSEQDQIRTLEAYIDRKAAEEIPAFKRMLEEEERKRREERKKRRPPPAPEPHLPNPATVTDQQLQRLSPDQKRDLAWQGLKDEFSVGNVGRNVAITLGVAVLGTLAVVTGSPVLLGAAVAAALVGAGLIIYDTVTDAMARWKDGDHVGAALSILKGLLYLGGIAAGVFGAPFLALGLIVGAIAIQLYQAHRDYEAAVDARNAAEFRKAIARAARDLEGAVSDAIGGIIAGGLGRFSKWFKGRGSAQGPAPAPPEPGAGAGSRPLPELKPPVATRPPATPEPPVAPEPPTASKPPATPESPVAPEPSPTGEPPVKTEPPAADKAKAEAEAVKPQAPVPARPQGTVTSNTTSSPPRRGQQQQGQQTSGVRLDSSSKQGTRTSDAGNAPRGQQQQQTQQQMTKVPTNVATERIRQIGKWEEQGKIVGGDTKALRDGLRKGSPEAEAEYLRIEGEIKRGNHVEVEPFTDTPAGHGDLELISTAGKQPLRNSPELRALIPDQNLRNDFMAWLKENHVKGDLGDELPLAAPGKPSKPVKGDGGAGSPATTPDKPAKIVKESHAHLDLAPAELLPWVKRWWKETHGKWPPPWRPNDPPDTTP